MHAGLRCFCVCVWGMDSEFSSLEKSDTCLSFPPTAGYLWAGSGLRKQKSWEEAWEEIKTAQQEITPGKSLVLRAPGHTCKMGGEERK